MPDEELSLEDGEEPDSSSPWRPVGWAVLALVLIALGSFAVGRNTTVASYTAPTLDDSSFDPVVSRPLPTAGMSLGLGENLLLGVTCPTRVASSDTTDYDSPDPAGSVAMSFRLVNWGQSRVLVTDLAVSGSSHGLGAAESTAGGSCDEPGHDPVGGALAPGESKLYTFWFKEPAGCPGSAKQIALGVRAESLTGTTTKAVTRELGDLYLTTCPEAPPAS